MLHSFIQASAKAIILVGKLTRKQGKKKKKSTSPSYMSDQMKAEGLILDRGPLANTRTPGGMSLTVS